MKKDSRILNELGDEGLRVPREVCRFMKPQYFLFSRFKRLKTYCAMKAKYISLIDDLSQALEQI
jgi:hypothetical protein